MKFRIKYKSEGNYDPDPPMPPAFVDIDATSFEDLKRKLLNNCPSGGYTSAVISLETHVKLDSLGSLGW